MFRCFLFTDSEKAERLESFVVREAFIFVFFLLSWSKNSSIFRPRISAGIYQYKRKPGVSIIAAGQQEIPGRFRAVLLSAASGQQID